MDAITKFLGRQPRAKEVLRVRPNGPNSKCSGKSDNLLVIHKFKILLRSQSSKTEQNIPF